MPRRMQSLTLVVASVVAVALALGGLSVSAATPSVTLAPSSGLPNDNFTIAGSGFPASSDVQIFWDGAAFDTDETDNAGSFNDPQSVPQASSGPHTVSVTVGTASASAVFTIGSAPTATSTSTPTATVTPTPTPTTTGVAAWQLGPALNVQRGTGAASVTLRSGAVLVTGGLVGGTSSTASAELWTVGAGAWAPTGSMVLGRSQQTATLLADGRVLVAGGVTSSGQTASAELYDPGTGTWSLTGSMASARYAHTATLLSDGTVLVAGGCCGPPGAQLTPSLASAEIYSPSTGTWHSVGAMATARNSHTATPLSDGSVLVAGGSPVVQMGSPSVTTTTSVERYLPQTGQWQSAGSLNFARTRHAATLLPDGTVLVVGGALGGCCAGMNSAERYSPTTNSWTVTGSMSAYRQFPTLSLLAKGTALVVGGYDCCNSPIPVAALTEVYSPASGTWAPSASLNQPRYDQTAVLLPDGTVVVTSGVSSTSGSVATNSERYVP